MYYRAVQIWSSFGICCFALLEPRQWKFKCKYSRLIEKRRNTQRSLEIAMLAKRNVKLNTYSWILTNF